jgi:hypothetical protein
MASLFSMVLVLGASMIAGGTQAAAAQTEVRDFAVVVDGKKAGNYQMTVTGQDDGSVVMTGKATIEVRYLVYKYRYSYSGREVWKSGRLIELASSCNDNGKAFNVTARAENDGLRVRVNGGERLTRADVWTTSYWSLPDAKFRNNNVPLLDADTGKDIKGRLSYVDTQQINVAGRIQNCDHYRVTGTPSPIDLWYDGQGRLVLQTFVEQGHRTTIQMTSLRR